MRNNLLCVAIAILLFGCNPDIFNSKAKACFDYSPLSNLKTSDTISFSNCSLNSNYSFWDFGDGSFSYEKEPKHRFRFLQSYRVKLFVANRPYNDTTNMQVCDTISRILNIDIGVPKANYWYKNILGSKIAFFNISDYATKCLWDFGDGTTSTEENPIHTYVHNGSYKVKLIISNDINSDSINNIITVNDEISLNNTNIPSLYAPFFLDIDKDGINDFEFYSYGFFSNTQSYDYTVVKTISDYKIYIDSITIINWQKRIYDDTTLYSPPYKAYFPKVYIVGDTINNLNRVSVGTLNITCRDRPHGNNTIYSGTYINNWIGDNIKYLCFRKIDGTRTKIGWIKMKVTDYSTATLISFKTPVEVENLLIDK